MDRKSLLKKLRKKAEKEQQDILKNKCWSSEEFSEIMDIPVPSLFEKEKKGHFFALEENGRKRWPHFQLSESQKKIPPYFDVVNIYLKEKGFSKWSSYQFWTVGNPKSKHFPPNIVSLRRGELKKVLSNVRSWNSHGGK